MNRRVFRFMASIVLAFFLQSVAVGQLSEPQNVGDYYGLYYAEWNNQETDLAALVISSYGKPIPPKANDPDAPTQPGLHIGQLRFPFVSAHFSSQGFSFRTARVGDTEYSFHGRFGREQVATISGVPYLEGVLMEMRNGRALPRKKIHFGHAVIL